MKTLTATALAALLCFSSPALVSSEGASAQTMPNVTGQYVFFYYHDLGAPTGFYEDILGFKPTFTEDWIRIYQVTPTSYLGIAADSEGAFHAPQENNAVMFSIVTDDVDGWYARLKSYPEVTFLKEIFNHPSAPIRAFMIADPGGYTLEVFQWLTDEDP